MKILAKNRRARFDYDIKETLIAGVVLTGPEVKSIKQGHVSLKGSYVIFENDEPVLVNAHVSPYRNAAQENYDETRRRKLLLHKSEIKRLIGLRQSNMQLVPLSVGLERGLVKIELGVGAGRKKHDKREYMKKREAERDISRSI